ncbi:LRR and NB-ARC domain disease resistance protein, partial [Trifolium medium]|nr:LRR and NB-ARC domain disease resistance protein [Trifolium medium]
MKNLGFCHFVHEDEESVPVGITRRLSIAISSNNVFKGINSSHFRAIHGFGKGGKLEPFISKLCSKSRILK